MQRWLLCFQKSVALVLSKLLLSSSQSFPDCKLAVDKYNLDHQQQLEYRTSSAHTGTGTGTGGGVGTGAGTGMGGFHYGGQKHPHSDSSTPAYCTHNMSGRVIKHADIQTIMRFNSEIVHQKISHHSMSHGRKSYKDEDNSYEKHRCSSNSEEDKWLLELGHGHGRHGSLAQRRTLSMESDTVHPISAQSSAESIILSERDTSESMCDDYPASEYCSSEKSCGSGFMKTNKIHADHLKPQSRPPAITVPCVPVEDLFIHSASRGMYSDYKGEKIVDKIPDSPLPSSQDRRDRERNRERDMYREGYNIPFSRSHSIGNSSQEGSERGYDYYKYGDVTDDDRSPSESEG